MNNDTVSKIHLDDEDALKTHLTDCGLTPSLNSFDARQADWRRVTYTLSDIVIGSTKSAAGWGFETQEQGDLYLFSFTHEGQSLWEMDKSGKIESSKKLCVVDTHRLVRGQFAPGTHTDTIIIDSVTLHHELAAAQGFPCSRRLEFQPLLNNGCRVWSTLNSIIHCMRTRLSTQTEFSSPLALAYLKQALVATIVETIPHNYKTNPISSGRIAIPRHVAKAIDYMQAHARENISLNELAQHANTSARNLQIGFNLYKDTTPLRYLRNIKLAAAHAEILDPSRDADWRAIAIAWGFSDLNLFSKYYKKIYGETPYQSSYKTKGPRS